MHVLQNRPECQDAASAGHMAVASPLLQPRSAPRAPGSPFAGHQQVRALPQAPTSASHSSPPAQVRPLSRAPAHALARSGAAITVCRPTGLT